MIGGRPPTTNAALGLCSGGFLGWPQALFRGMDEEPPPPGRPSEPSPSAARDLQLLEVRRQLEALQLDLDVDGALRLVRALQSGRLWASPTSRRSTASRSGSSWALPRRGASRCAGRLPGRANATPRPSRQQDCSWNTSRARILSWRASTSAPSSRRSCRASSR